MHAEAFTYTRQTLGQPRPTFAAALTGEAEAGPLPGDVEVGGGLLRLGASGMRPHFVFDNEKWAHPVEIAPFRIARAPVTNAEFAAFVEDGGYANGAIGTSGTGVARGSGAESIQSTGAATAIAGWCASSMSMRRSSRIVR